MNQTNLINFLEKHKDIILTKWFNQLIEIYPPETVRHLKNVKDPFANPLGSNIKLGIEGVLEELIKEMNQGKLQVALEKIIKIKAVQELSPSQAVSFIYLLKKVIIDELAINKETQISLHDFLDLDGKIDTIALMTFEIYMGCREKVNQLRIEEVKKRLQILERVNMFDEKLENSCCTQS